MIENAVGRSSFTDNLGGQAMCKAATRFGCALLGFVLLATAGQERVDAEDKAPIKTSKERAADRELRVWSTIDQNYTTFARLLSFDGKLVKLQKEDGRTVTLPLDKLTEDDQDYVANEFGGSPKSETSATPTADPPAPASRASDDPSELESKCRELCDQISGGYDGKTGGVKPTIAVVEFSNFEGGVTNLGRLLSEELITRLFATGKYEVIERLLLTKTIEEHRLKLQGLVDPKSAKELGKILGAEAIVSGTIADLGDSIRVNARLISTETGKVLSVAASTMRKEELPSILTVPNPEKQVEVSNELTGLDLEELEERKQQMIDIIDVLQKNNNDFESKASRADYEGGTEYTNNLENRKRSRQEARDYRSKIAENKKTIASHRQKLAEVENAIAIKRKAPSKNGE